MSSTTKKNCLDGYSGSNGWDLASRDFANVISSVLVPDPNTRDNLLKKESELKEKHCYYLKRFCDDSIFCDICNQTKLKINVFKNNNEVGNDSHYLACVRCKRP